MVDADRSGSIDFEELKSAFYSLGRQMPEKVLKRVSLFPRLGTLSHVLRNAG